MKNLILCAFLNVTTQLFATASDGRFFRDPNALDILNRVGLQVADFPIRTVASAQYVYKELYKRLALEFHTDKPNGNAGYFGMLAAVREFMNNLPVNNYTANYTEDFLDQNNGLREYVMPQAITLAVAAIKNLNLARIQAAAIAMQAPGGAPAAAPGGAAPAAAGGGAGIDPAEAGRRAEQQRRAEEEFARRQAEAQRQAEARRQAEEFARRQAEEFARRQAEAQRQAEARRQAEEFARRQAEEFARRQAEAQRQAEEFARQAEARRQAAEAAAQRQAEERRRAAAEQQRWAEEAEARRRAAAEQQRQAEAQRRAAASQQNALNILETTTRNAWTYFQALQIYINHGIFTEHRPEKLQEPTTLLTIAQNLAEIALAHHNAFNGHVAHAKEAQLTPDDLRARVAEALTATEGDYTAIQTHINSGVFATHQSEPLMTKLAADALTNWQRLQGINQSLHA